MHSGERSRRCVVHSHANEFAARLAAHKRRAEDLNERLRALEAGKVARSVRAIAEELAACYRAREWRMAAPHAEWEACWRALHAEARARGVPLISMLDESQRAPFVAFLAEWLARRAPGAPRDGAEWAAEADLCFTMMQLSGAYQEIPAVREDLEARAREVLPAVPGALACAKHCDAFCYLLCSVFPTSPRRGAALA